MKNILFGAIIGIVMTVGVLSMFGIAAAHTETINYMGSKFDHHSMMHGSMHELENMSCSGMDIEEMDNNNDGICDICGMDIEHCREMKNHECPMMG